MNRQERLRACLGDSPEELALATQLAELPVRDVGLIVLALRTARKAGAADEQERRRRSRKSRVRSDDEKVADAAGQLSRSLATRAAGTLETLALLKRHYDNGPAMLALAVAGARANGYSDADIGRALGVTGSAVGERYGRRGAAPASDTPRPQNAAGRQDQLEGRTT